eukprot:COSAG06_NODE_1021_length_11055_cov_7.993976_9_plen_186_part_00
MRCVCAVCAVCTVCAVCVLCVCCVYCVCCVCTVCVVCDVRSPAVGSAESSLANSKSNHQDAVLPVPMFHSSMPSLPRIDPNATTVRRKRIISFAMPFDARKLIILPRQARDKHRESTQKETRFAQDQLGDGGHGGGGGPGGGSTQGSVRPMAATLDMIGQVRKTLCLTTLYAKTRLFTKTGSGQT